MMKRCFYVSVVTVSSFLVLHCSPDPSIYPLAEGKQWEYEAKYEGQYGGNSLLIAVTNMAKREVGGVEMTPQKYEVKAVSDDTLSSTSFIFVAENEEGIYSGAQQASTDVEPKLESPPVYYIKYPLKVGTSWQARGLTYLVFNDGEAIDVDMRYEIDKVDETVTVPAGTFTGCVRAAGAGSGSENLGIMALGSTAEVTVDEHSLFCPGVGFVKSFRSEKSNHMMVGSAQISYQLVRHGSRG